MHVNTITRYAQNCTMGASLYPCGPTMPVAKTMWTFLDNFFFLLCQSQLLEKKKKAEKTRIKVAVLEGGVVWPRLATIIECTAPVLEPEFVWCTVVSQSFSFWPIADTTRKVAEKAKKARKKHSVSKLLAVFPTMKLHLCQYLYLWLSPTLANFQIMSTPALTTLILRT